MGTIGCLSSCGWLRRGATAAALLLALHPQPSQAADYWTCESPAYRFEVKADAARCYREGAKQSFEPARCAAPAAKIIDHRAKVDACVSGPIAGDLVCLEPGTRIEIGVGADRCIRYGTADIRAPGKQVTR